jgi:hypothetical protein
MKLQVFLSMVMNLHTYLTVRDSSSSSFAVLALQAVAYLGIFSGWGLTNSVEDRGQRERGFGGGRPLVRGSGQFSNE